MTGLSTTLPLLALVARRRRRHRDPGGRAMSTHARIAVRSTHTETFGWAWAASVEHADAVLDCEAGYAPTREAAQAAAYAALGGMQQRLMDEVFESRASRRQHQANVDVHTMEPTA